jgi:hypothetical protein
MVYRKICSEHLYKTIKVNIWVQIPGVTTHYCRYGL